MVVWYIQMIERILQLSKEVENIFNKPDIPCKDCHQYTSDRGCCTGCAKNEGFFSGLEEDLYVRQLEALKDKYGFDRRYGFFNVENNKCSLPYQCRSYVCNSFMCHIMEQDLSSSECHKVYYNTKEIRSLKTKLDMIK